jgi:hypothetical protein
VLYAKKLHNIFMQILSEFGIVGVVIWLWLWIDFWRRLRRLRRKPAVAYWKWASGGKFDVAAISLGLECAMIGFLANGFFYNQIYIHWSWTLICLAYLLDVNTRRAPRRNPTAREPGGPMREPSRQGAAGPKGSGSLAGGLLESTTRSA